MADPGFTARNRAFIRDIIQGLRPNDPHATAIRSAVEQIGAPIAQAKPEKVNAAADRIRAIRYGRG